MDHLLIFEREITNIFNSRKQDKSDALLVGDLADHTPSDLFGWASHLYFNPYSEWRNLVLMPALMWASLYAIASGPWETVIFTLTNGFSGGSYSSYVLMQIKAMFWGPIQIVYYILRASTFIALIPYNLFVFFLDVNFLLYVFASWFLYFLRAVVWWMDAAYVLSKFWINDSEGFITVFLDLLFFRGLFTELLFFWFWIPVYYLVMVGEWIYGDTFESRPTQESLYDLYA